MVQCGEERLVPSRVPAGFSITNALEYVHPRDPIYIDSRADHHVTFGLRGCGNQIRNHARQNVIITLTCSFSLEGESRTIHNTLINETSLLSPAQLDAIRLFAVR